MPTIVQFRRGTTAQNNNFTGAVGELSVDTTLDTLRVHDGVTQGGFEIVNTSAVQTLSNKKIGSNLVPDTDSAYDLGSASFKWKDLYLSGNTIFLGNAEISASGSSVVLPAGTQIGGTTIAALDSAGIRGLFSAAGDLTYNSSTGEFSFDVENVYTQSNFDSDFNTSLDNASLNGTGLSYNSGTNTLSITDTGVSAGTYGSASQVPVFTVNAQGQLDSAGVVSVAGVSSTAWDSATGNLIISTADGGSFYTNVTLDPYSTTDLAEGTNLYYTSARADSDARTAVSVTDAGGDGSLTYSAASGTFTYTGPSAGEVRAHFSGGTGITITDGTITTTDAEIVHDNLSGYVANEHIDHSSVTLTAGVGLTGGGDLTVSRTFAIDSAEFLANFESSITHDNLTGVTANEHIDHSSVTLTAGNGLTGGGDITTSRSFAVGAGTGVTVNADNVAIGQDVATTADVTFGSVTTTGNVVVGGNLQVTGTTTTVNAENLEVADNMIYLNAAESDGSPTQSVDVGWAANVNDDGSYAHVGMFRDATDNKFKVFEGYSPEPDADVQINTGHASFSLAPFAARTLEGKYLGADSDIDARLSGGTGITYSSGTISTNDGQIVHDNLSGFVANEHIDHSTVSITAGNGLTGGGTIAATRTLNIGEGTGITVSADAISTNDAEIVHDNLSGFVANEHIDHSTVSITAGDGLTGGGTIAATRTIAVGAGTLIDVTADAVNVDLSELSTSTTDGDGDYFVVVDTSNAQRKLTKGNINISGFNNDAGYSTTTGTVTSVTVSAGTGLSGGGTITSSGTATLNVDLSELTDMTATMTGTDEFIVLDGGADRRKAANEIGLSIFSNDAGFTTNTGTVTSVGITAGNLIDVSGSPVTTSGNITVNVDLSELTTSTSNADGDYFVVVDTSNNQKKLTKGNINISEFNNDAGFTTNVGDITGVNAGFFMTGGGTSGSVTLNVDATDANTASKVVARDASGNFQAGTIFADLTGDVTGTASVATSVNVEQNNATNETTYIAFVDGSTGTQGIETDTALTYNPLTNTLTAGIFSGNATTASAWATGRTISLTGDVTGTSGSFDGSSNLSFATTIASNVVGADELNVSGNGTAGQALLSDGDGTFSWGSAGATITDDTSTNTTQYLAMSRSTTGSLTTAYVAGTILTFNPSTGVLASTDFNSTSDESLKTNIETIQNATEKVSQLRGVNFNWKNNDRYAMGVIAQEVEKIIPEVVNEENGIKSVSYGAIVGLLIEAIKDLQQQVDDLKS